MARRLCFEERVRIEAMAQAGVGARRRRPGGWAATPQRCSASSGATAARAATTRGRRRTRLAPGRAGPRPPSWPLMLSWEHLPRQQRRRKPRGRTEQAKRSALGEFRPLAERPAKAAARAEPGHWEGDLIIAKANHTAVATLVERTSRHTLVVPLPDGYNAPATARAVTRRAGPPAPRNGQNPDLGPGTRDGPLGRHRKNPRHRGVLLRARAPPGSARPTSKPTACCDAGSPKAPTSTSAQCASPSSKTTSTPCPENSTTGTQPKPSTMTYVATTDRACPPSWN